ncbi:DUF4411 family protein [Bifidobacterium sp. CP2]|nr:DUF4411 family protein [Bifidobacterium sp. CP2]
MSTTNGSTQASLFSDVAPKYLIDTNCLIKPYNTYYAPDFKLSQPFWNQLKTLVKQGAVGVLDKVRDETYGGRDSDQLDIWLDSITPYVIATENDVRIVTGFHHVIQAIGLPSSGYQPKAIRDWDNISIADP